MITKQIAQRMILARYFSQTQYPDILRNNFKNELFAAALNKATRAKVRRLWTSRRRMFTDSEGIITFKSSFDKLMQVFEAPEDPTKITALIDAKVSALGEHDIRAIAEDMNKYEIDLPLTFSVIDGEQRKLSEMAIQDARQECAPDAFISAMSDSYNARKYRLVIAIWTLYKLLSAGLQRAGEVYTAEALKNSPTAYALTFPGVGTDPGEPLPTLDELFSYFALSIYDAPPTTEFSIDIIGFRVTPLGFGQVQNNQNEGLHMIAEGAYEYRTPALEIERRAWAPYVLMINRPRDDTLNALRWAIVSGQLMLLAGTYLFRMGLERITFPQGWAPPGDDMLREWVDQGWVTEDCDIAKDPVVDARVEGEG